MTNSWVTRAEAIKPVVQNFVNGRRLTPAGSLPLEKYGPRDGKWLYQINPSAASDVNDAVMVARDAFEDGRWTRLPIQRRKDILHRLAALIEQHSEELALLESLDVGKPISDALGFDVPSAAAFIRFNAEAIDKHHSRVFGVDPNNLSYELYRPVGIVGGIVGWNFPLLLAAQKIGPVLATGNCLVLKPSEFTSLSTCRLAELATEAGVPEGVVNVIHGDSVAGDALARHGDIDLLTFTGSSRTGKRLLVAAGESNMKRLVLECGGKAPNIVFDDCPNLETAADSIVKLALWNQGQVCVATSRLLLQEGIYSQLLELVINKALVRVPGDPLLPETNFAALINENHIKKVLNYVASGRRDGAHVHVRSSAPPHAGGFYVSPIILEKLPPNHPVAQEEIFGPVLTVLPFKTEREAISIANSTEYGLSAVAWTADPGRAHRLAHGIRAGAITLNATADPSGGPSDTVLSTGGLKQSGIGVEGGLSGLESYLTKTAVQMFV